MRRVRRRGAIAAGALVLAATSARADSYKKRDAGVGFVETFVARARLQSPMPVNGDDAPRDLVGMGVPVSSATLFGAGVGVEARMGFLTERLFELRYAASGGAQRIGVAEGSAVSASTGAINVLELGSGLPIPGLQIVSDDRAWKLGLAPAWGISRTWTTATLTDARGAVSHGGIVQTDGYFRVDLKLCARLGRPPAGASWAPWGCLTAEPYVYARDWWSGVAFGARIDL